MKAIVHVAYGPPEVLELKEVDRPVPRDNEVLIRIVATTVTAAECAMRKGEPRWADPAYVPMLPEAPMISTFCPLWTFALSRRKYSAVDAPSTAAAACSNVTLAGLSPTAVQLARHFGAEVTGVCGTRNRDLVLSLGAANVIDYTQEDFTRSGETYDVIFDTVGKSSFAQCKGSLKKNGSYIPTTGLSNIFLGLWTSVTGGKKVLTGMSVQKNAALLFLKEHIEAGKLTIVIDRSYPLEQIVEAHRYVDTGHKTGNVVINVSR